MTLNYPARYKDHILNLQAPSDSSHKTPQPPSSAAKGFSFLGLWKVSLMNALLLYLPFVNTENRLCERRQSPTGCLMSSLELGNEPRYDERQLTVRLGMAS
jgi:hypothetical protein